MISPATIDRIMPKQRIKYNKRGRSTTKPGALLKKRIPIKTNQWDETIPGFLEADTVAHCEDSVAGMFVYSINCVDNPQDGPRLEKTGSISKGESFLNPYRLNNLPRYKFR